MLLFPAGEGIGAKRRKGAALVRSASDAKSRNFRKFRLSPRRAHIHGRQTMYISAPFGFCYFAISSQYRMMIVAISARVALSFGLSVDAVLPEIKPLPTAHCIAGIAHSETSKASS